MSPGEALQSPGTLLVFWDYDTQWGADRSRAPGGRKSWGPLEFENTDRLLELHSRYEIPACFAVVGAAALPGERPYHDPGQIRRIHAAGHEIASHSFRHEWLPRLDRGALLESLRRSKDALEQCIGAPVEAFVPPYNQPFDYPGGFAISLSERREVRRDRTDLRRLLDSLAETGYRFCRVGYHPLHLQLAERLLGRRLVRPSRVERIRGITCVRHNACGFDDYALAVLNRAARVGGVVGFYGHPHSIRSGNPQDERWLLPFVEQVRRLRDQGRIRIALPKELVHARRPDSS